MRLFSPQDIQQAAALLKKGELIAFPTETVYGLGALLSQESALKKIYLAKGRPSDNPLIVHLLAIQDVLQVACDIPDIFWKLSAFFSPGPLTYVLKKAPIVPAIISGGLDTIAVRFPSHPIARELLEATGEAIAAPSANLSGKPSGTQASHILEDFEDKIAGVIDGGKAPLGLESTVINLTVTPPVILRPGTVTKEAIEDVLGLQLGDKVGGEALMSPGMKYRHYAPKASIKLFTSEADFVSTLSLPSQKQAILARVNNRYPYFFPLSGESLYATLRHLDAQGFEKIIIFCDPVSLQNAALMNRLFHASKN
jgi:L-threonylcarbamoyladenylate synthase